MKNAEAIIAVSENTKKDLINICGIPEQKINVIYEAADECFKKINNIKRNEHTLLCVSNELPHKNLTSLFKAIAIVKKIIPQIKIIKIGSSGWKGARDKLKMLIYELDLVNSVEFKENVADLTYEYNSATALVFPSLYEGFGLPILEAMACGCPVICSNTSSVPEIAGNAAEYFNPYDENEMAEKIIKIINDKNLREDLAKKGLERTKLFSWKKCAKETTAIYVKTVKQFRRHL